ncbi:hypothetical protein NDU88_001413 [Pleurodeles waltl]|uniref:Uncharacterized protein n=1 Tax=Pleurodeles waltl TaxID=8319 RepID=A0AAV7UUN8_PLEWA|nr:hypothetical protein NDU88_001413 [Pleurodeles waltl]
MTSEQRTTLKTTTMQKQETWTRGREREREAERETEDEKRGIGGNMQLKPNDLKGRRGGPSKKETGPDCREDEDRLERERRKEPNGKVRHAPGGAWLPQVWKCVGDSQITLSGRVGRNRDCTKGKGNWDMNDIKGAKGKCGRTVN